MGTVEQLPDHLLGAETSEGNSSRSEVTNRVVFGLITWFAGLGKSSREFVYIYIFSRCTFAVT